MTSETCKPIRWKSEILPFDARDAEVQPPPGFHLATEAEKRNLPTGSRKLNSRVFGSRYSGFSKFYSWDEIKDTALETRVVSTLSRYVCPDLTVFEISVLHKMAVTIEIDHLKLSRSRPIPPLGSADIAIKEAKIELAKCAQGKVYSFMKEVGHAPDASKFKLAFDGTLEDVCVPTSKELANTIEAIRTRLESQLTEVRMNIEKLRRNRFSLAQILINSKILNPPINEQVLLKRQEVLQRLAQGQDLYQVLSFE